LPSIEEKRRAVDGRAAFFAIMGVNRFRVMAVFG